MFIDRAKIYVKAGDGGDGCTSHYRDRYTRHPIPDGGDGGNGGEIVIRADENKQTLYDFQYRRHFRAKNGRNGSGKGKKGRGAPSIAILVPPGTIIKDSLSNTTLRDLAAPNDEVRVVKGGRGGRGNWTKKEAAEGACGEEKNLILELKLVADVGIIGYPNAGKSTLISRITNARSKIAAYPFTTRAPVLGVVKIPGGEYTVADIPGLIEGAHLGKGLGLDFLRHIERTRLLVHLIDMAGTEGRLPADDYVNLNKELRCYSRELGDKPQIVAANKMDLPGSRENLTLFGKKYKGEYLEISALTGGGLKELVFKIWKTLEQIKGQDTSLE